MSQDRFAGYSIRQFVSILPELIVVGWLAFLAFATWEHAKHAEMPPIWDAYTYYEKSQNAWTALSQNKSISSLLNVPPAVRPPGTILMAYPFGFVPDFRGFYFRSIYTAICLLVAAIYLAIWQRGMRSSLRWLLATSTIAATTFGGFWHFEPPGLHSPVYWGLVDSFFAGIAAISAAAGIRYARDRKFIWAIVAIIFSVICPFVKPVGMGVMLVLLAPLLMTVWLPYLASIWRNTILKSRVRPQSFTILARFRRGSFLPLLSKDWQMLVIPLLALAICSSVVVVCYRSDYFSRENIAFGAQVIKNLHDHWAPRLTKEFLENTVFPALGYFWLLILAFGTLLAFGCAILVWKRRMRCEHITFTVLAYFFAAAAASWYVWGVKFGFVEIRYNFPFFFILFISSLFLLIMVGQMASSKLILTGSAVALLPAINLALLLLTPTPSNKWQLASGVSVSVHDVSSVVKIVQSILERQLPKGNLNVYFLSYGKTIEMFAFDSSLNFYGRDFLSRHKEIRTHFRQLRPTNDWTTSPVIKLRELKGAQYIVFATPEGHLPGLNRFTKDIPTWQKDITRLEAWLLSLEERGIVQNISTDKHIQILQVTAPLVFSIKLRSIAKTMPFSEHFLVENRDILSIQKSARGLRLKGMEKTPSF